MRDPDGPGDPLPLYSPRRKPVPSSITPSQSPAPALARVPTPAPPPAPAEPVALPEPPADETDTYLLDLLRTLSDREVESVTGVPRKTLARLRRKARIPRHTRRGPRPSCLPPPGTSSSEYARTLGISRQAVHARRRRQHQPPLWARIDWAPFDALLGTMPDEALAAQVGCQRTAVLKRRRRLGIPPFAPKGA